MHFTSRLCALVAAISLSTAGFAAGGKYGMAGCGLGAMLIGDGPGWMGQTFAATTNGSTFIQGFALSSGTSECIDDNAHAQLRMQERFVSSNYQELSKQMARGEGDTLRAFSQTFNCQDASFSQFANRLKQSYSKITSTPGPDAMLDAVRTEISSDPVLGNSCIS